MIVTIFKKELKDTLRDRRTLMTMIVIPILIFPVIMTLFLKVSESFNASAAEKKFHIGIVNASTEFTNQLNEAVKTIGNTVLIPIKDSSELKKHIKSDSLQFGISVPLDFNQKSNAAKTVDLPVFFNATELGMKERGEAILKLSAENVRNARLKAKNIDLAEITPYSYSYKNVASDKETLGKLIGGFLPYLFITFGFVGCMYPAIDLFTGEKERGTLETLLTTPVSRWQILIGKMGVVVLSGFMAAAFTLIGIGLTISVFNIIDDPRILAVIRQILTIEFVLMLFTLLLPMLIFFAGIMIPIAVYAKSFKEAQSIITPLNIIVILPALVGFFPGISLNAVTASIPIVNFVLATKELVAGTLEINYLLLSFGVMVLLAGLSISFAFSRFDKESNLVN
jgi:sodium transport system permease protein